MNAPDQSKIVVPDLEEEGRLALLTRYKAEEIQYLGRDDLLAAQVLAGHGSEWGCWTTPVSQTRNLPKTYRNINLAQRLRVLVEKEEVTAASVDLLVEEGTLVVTRLALLMKLVPTAGRTGDHKSSLLKASSIADQLYKSWPKITARALLRKASDPTKEGLFRLLTEPDVMEFKAERKTRVEVDRLHTLAARGVWADEPPMPNIRQTTDLTKSATRYPEEKSEPFSPLPEEWLAEIGPRVLWIVQDLGPNLLWLLEALRDDLKGVDWSSTISSTCCQVSDCIKSHIELHPWVDHAGKPLSPPFSLATSTGKQGADRFEWPPRRWEQVTLLSMTLQSAHLFITLLSCAGRISEVSTLQRGCITIQRDGKEYLKGFTYKLSGNLLGDVRTWPAPEILRQCLGQQARLAAARDWLPRSITNGMPDAPQYNDDLWVSIAVSGNSKQDLDLSFNNALFSLAERLDMDPMPGGKNVHAHRFRKTVGRLAGVALWNSPLVLKRLFGHKSIEMTLHYILCDPGIREEAEKVLRELRIMHCAEALEEIHQAMRDGAPLPGHGGPGAARLVTAVRKRDAQLGQSGRVWSEGSAYDLACLLTMQGQGWRLIKENIICSKAPGEDGLCQKKRSKGQPNTANCQPQCDNRIVFARKRCDIELSIEQYLDIARQARDDGQLLVLASVMDNVREEWDAFPDLEQIYRADPEVQALLAMCEEPEAVEVAA